MTLRQSFWSLVISFSILFTSASLFALTNRNIWEGCLVGLEIIGAIRIIVLLFCFFVNLSEK